MSNSKPPKFCIYCQTMLWFGYQDNNPENGPAGYNCGNTACQLKILQWEWNALSPEEKKQVQQEENDAAPEPIIQGEYDLYDKYLNERVKDDFMSLDFILDR